MNFITLHKRLTLLCWLCLLASAGLLGAYYNGAFALTNLQFTALFSIGCAVLFIAPRYVWFKPGQLTLLFAIAAVVVYLAVPFHGGHMAVAIVCAFLTYIIGSCVSFLLMLFSPHRDVFAIAVHKARLKEQHIWGKLTQTHHLPADPIAMWDHVLDVEDRVEGSRLRMQIIALCAHIATCGLDENPEKIIYLDAKRYIRLMAYVERVSQSLAEYNESCS